MLGGFYGFTKIITFNSGDSNGITEHTSSDYQHKNYENTGTTTPAMDTIKVKIEIMINIKFILF